MVCPVVVVAAVVAVVVGAVEVVAAVVAVVVVAVVAVVVVATVVGVAVVAAVVAVVVVSALETSTPNAWCAADNPGRTPSRSPVNESIVAVNEDPERGGCPVSHTEICDRSKARYRIPAST